VSKYSKQGLWSLFLICAFPLHLWTLILVFRDMDWVIKRTNVWDAVGVGAYGMLFAFIESVIVFAVLVLLGLLIPKRWQSERRVAFLSLLVIITALWAMFGQLRFLWDLSLPLPVIVFLARSDHPFRLLYAIYLAVVVPSILLPVYFFIRSNHSVKWMQELTERLSTLTMFYLLFDAVGLVIIILRNLS
jgi:hypothetical protein